MRFLAIVGLTATVSLAVASGPALAGHGSGSYVTWVTASPSGPPPWQNDPLCWTSPHQTTVCVEPTGDYMWVRDGQADGKSGLGRTKEAFEHGTPVWYCRNKMGAGTWGYCNVDWIEGTIVSVRGGTYDADTDTSVLTFLFDFTNGG